MSLAFYFCPMSTSTTTECVLAELNIPHTRHELNIDAGDTRKPEFLKLNPNGRVPVIVDEGVPIWESVAVNIHLGEKYGIDKGLFPSGGIEKAKAMQWMVWANTTLGEAAGRLSASLPSDVAGAVQSGSRDF